MTSLQSEPLPPSCLDAASTTKNVLPTTSTRDFFWGTQPGSSLAPPPPGGSSGNKGFPAWRGGAGPRKFSVGSAEIFRKYGVKMPKRSDFEHFWGGFSPQIFGQKFPNQLDWGQRGICVTRATGVVIYFLFLWHGVTRSSAADAAFPVVTLFLLLWLTCRRFCFHIPPQPTRPALPRSATEQSFFFQVFFQFLFLF